MRDLVVAIAAGVVQGVFEWLPVSSEGNVALFLVVVLGARPADAVGLALFLHAGTAVAAAGYFRAEVESLLATAVSERGAALRGGTTAFEGDTADLAFFGVATLVSVVVGGGAYLALASVATALSGGAFVAVVGALLIATGLVERGAGAAVTRRETPSVGDALLVGGLQGLAVLPGVSRSGTTAGALLLRGHDPDDAFRLSFLLSIPAAFGAGVVVLLDGGLPGISPVAAVAALAASAVVGYATVGALMALVRRVQFWAVAVALGALAVAGGLALAL